MGDTNWSGGAQGAIGGGMAGYQMGGPWGAAAGAGLGGLLGLFTGGESDNDAKTRQMLMDYYNKVNGRQAPTGTAVGADYSNFRQNQSNLISRLEALSAGKGPSLAAEQFKQATDQNMNQQASMANSGRGGPLAAFTAANNMGNLGAQAAQGSAIARTGEELGAFGQLGGAINQGRTSDESMNQFNAQQQNYMTEANIQSRLKTMGMNDQSIASLLGMLQGQNQFQTGKEGGLGPQLMAGGAGMFSMGASQRGQQNANNMMMAQNNMSPGQTSAMGQWPWQTGQVPNYGG
jgi:hypothetical protein